METGSLRISDIRPDFIYMMEQAVKAPSGHNTQPWLFRVQKDRIQILPDMSKSLPAVDPDNRELFISLGCAVENLCIAASYFGYTTHIIECSIEAIILELTKNDLTIEDSLFHQIEKRQTNRNIYNGNKISDGILQQLQSIPKENGIQFYFTEINTPFANTITQIHNERE